GDGRRRRGSAGSDDDTALESTAATLQGIAAEMDRADSPFMLGGDEWAGSATRGRDRAPGGPVRRLRPDAVEPLVARVAPPGRAGGRASGPRGTRSGVGGRRRRRTGSPAALARGPGAGLGVTGRGDP